MLPALLRALYLCVCSAWLHFLQLFLKLSIADEFISHTFKAHLLAAVCAEFGVTSAHDNIPHDTSLEWLETTARSIFEKRLVPHESRVAITVPMAPLTSPNSVQRLEVSITRAPCATQTTVSSPGASSGEALDALCPVWVALTVAT